MAGLTKNEEEALKLFKEKLLANFNDRIDSTQLFGSKARGDAQKHSDVDVLVVIKDATWKDRLKVSALSADVLLETEAFITTKTFSPEQMQEMKEHRAAFWQNIEPDLIPL